MHTMPVINVKNDSTNTTLNHIRTLIRRGAYAEAVGFGQSLPVELRSQPAMALQRIRAVTQQGDMAQAESVFVEIDRQAAQPGESIILALEAASLHIFRHADFTNALQSARQTLAETANLTLSTAEQAEAERVYARIALTAATYYLIDASEQTRILQRLPILAETLQEAGWIGESLAARLTHAERVRPLQSQLDALAEVAQLARLLQHPALAAEALLRRATLLMKNGAEDEVIESDLAHAAQLYTQAEHVYGQLDIDYLRATRKIEREYASSALLTPVLAGYEALAYHRGVINVLLDLSQLAHQRGDIPAAIGYRQQLIERAEAVGMGLLRESQQTGLVDLLIRNQSFGAAIEQCQAALVTHPSPFMAAGFEQLLATAYGFVNNIPAAIKHARHAMESFESLGVDDSASTAALVLASNLDSLRQDDAWQESEILLQRWQERDQQRNDLASALSKSELRAQSRINRYLYSSTDRGNLTILQEADDLLSQSMPLTAGLQGRDGVLRAGALQQMRAQIHNLRNDIPAVIDDWQCALEIYRTGGLAMEAANCHYIIGAFNLNLANQQLQPHFGESERNLLAALDYYTAAYMRGQAADSRFMLARLYVNASLRVDDPLRGQLLDAALNHLANAESDYDAIRREYRVGSTLEAQQAKRELIAKSRRIYELALEIVTLHRLDPVDAWQWTQRAKARALTDTLGAGTFIPERLRAAIESYPESVAALEEEDKLLAAIEAVTADQLPERRMALDAHYAKMMEDPHLADYLEVRLGLPLAIDDLTALADGGGHETERCVFIDWIAVEDRLFFVAIRPGETPYVERLALSVTTVQHFVADNLNERTFRLTLRDLPEQLRALDSLIYPISLVSHPGDLLILSPSGPLHALPLHALEIAGEPLITRNPLVYTPSLAVLRQCVSTRNVAQRVQSAALFGDPNEDTAQAVEIVQRFAGLFASQQVKTAIFLGQQVTHSAFQQACQGQDLIYFHGHAIHEPSNPLASHLKLADANFQAQEIFTLPNLRAELIILAACQSAASVIATGDEPLGLIPAFLVAGGRSVLAGQWNIQRPAAARFMQHFFSSLFALEMDNSPASEARTQQPPATMTGVQQVANKARSLQQAMLALRADPNFATPYHWAPFMLYGDWH